MAGSLIITATNISVLIEDDRSWNNCMLGCPTNLGYVIYVFFSILFLWGLSWLISVFIRNIKGARNIK